jgi:hypothetical protein
VVVVHRLPAAFTRKKVQRRATARFFLMLDTEGAQVSFVVNEVTRRGVFNENAAGQVIDDRAKEVALL